jgi:hypothetical protein
VADVGLIAGGVLAASGVGLLVYGYGRSTTQSGWLRAVPSVASSGGGLVFEGGW